MNFLEKINRLDKDQFIFKDVVVAGEDCWLIYPNHSDAKWTKENLCFRSVVVNKVTGEILSAGFTKFFNAGQSPELYPDPNNYKDWFIQDKLDGSCILISKYKGELIVRTRQTVDVSIHKTGPEVLRLVEDLNLKNYPYLNNPVTFLFEHTTNTRKIVLDYPEPRLTLLDIVFHDDYSYMDQVAVDEIAEAIGVARPTTFNFNSIEEIIELCKTLKDTEGFVLSYNGNANRVKLKTDDYLLKHRLKSELGNIDKVLDLWLTWGKPSAENLYNHIVAKIDFEVAERVKPDIDKIEEAYLKTEELATKIDSMLLDIKGLARKEQAVAIIKEFGSLAPFAFTRLDGKSWGNEQCRKLVLQFLKD